MESDRAEAVIWNDRWQEARQLIDAIHALPIEHDSFGHAFKRINCRSMDDMGAWVALVKMRLDQKDEADKSN